MGKEISLALLFLLSFFSNIVIDCFYGQCYARNICNMLDDNYDRSGIKVLQIMKNRNRQIAFISDDLGNIFLVKQELRPEPWWQLYIVRERLAAYIAKLVKIPANRVNIIPAGFTMPGKFDQKRPATLHTLVPGVPVIKAPKQFKLYIQQPKKDKVPKELWGLTRCVIRNMSVHQDLAKIVAFDTFIGNGDRHRNNYFYDEKSNRFFAIDLESSFRNDLTGFACKLVKTMIKNEEKISQKELDGLIIYRDILQQLIKCCPPHVLNKKLDLFIIQARTRKWLYRSSHMQSAKIFARIKLYRKNITQSYKGIKKLIALLGRFITQSKKDIKKYS